MHSRLSERREVRLWSADPQAVEATRATIASIGGALSEEDGKFFVEGTGFVFWAAHRQGYVAEVLPR